MNELMCCDVLEGLATIPDNSINLIIADPPYYKVCDADWDNQWDSFEAYLSWCSMWLKECKRVMRDNASLYVFGDDLRISYLQVEIDKLGLPLLNHIVWYKINNIPIKWWGHHRKFCPVKEHILFYGGQEDAWGTACEGAWGETFNPIREYLEDARQKAGLTQAQVNEVCGTASIAGGHYFSRSQWCMPTKEHYEQMQKGFNGHLTREYEDLRREYEDLRRVWHPSNKLRDVINIPITNNSERLDHPTQKPLELISLFIEASSNPDDVVLDLFAGTGTTSVSAKRAGRRYIAIEQSKEYCAIIRERLAKTKVSKHNHTSQRTFGGAP